MTRLQMGCGPSRFAQITGSGLFRALPEQGINGDAQFAIDDFHIGDSHLGNFLSAGVFEAVDGGALQSQLGERGAVLGGGFRHVG
jgi:hypothetical protein